MAKNLYSLGLLRNGKVYQNKVLAIQGLTQIATNDGVAKLARYLEPVLGGEPIIRTLVGFYANAEEMEDAGGGQSSYTILDIDGNASDITEIKAEIIEINGKIGVGIDGKTLTEAINEVNATLGTGFTTAHTVTEALEELDAELTKALTISLDVAEAPSSGYLKTYVLSQGLDDKKREIGRIDIPKDMVVSGGSLVHGTWDGDTFTEDPEGPDMAIKIEFANKDVIYINTKDLVDFYTAGNAAIDVDNNNNTIALKLDPSGETFLTISENGLKLSGVQIAIDTKVEAVAERERLSGSDGISIASNKVKAVAANYSGLAIKNPITVDNDGIKFSKYLDCGFYDNVTVIALTAADINAIANPLETDVFIAGSDALNAMSADNTFNNIDVADVEANSEVYLYAVEGVNVDGIAITGVNGHVSYSAPKINISTAYIANGSFDGDKENQNLELLKAQFVTVDNPSLANDAFNVYNLKNDAVISISDSKFNLTVDNSNVLMVSNYSNATGVTVNFENVEWTYENSRTQDDWRLAGLIEYKPSNTDEGLGGDLTAMKTWKFNFKNCKYNGVKVTANNFGEHNQVFFLHNVGGDGSIKDAVEEGLDVTFE